MTHGLAGVSPWRRRSVVWKQNGLNLERDRLPASVACEQTSLRLAAMARILHWFLAANWAIHVRSAIIAARSPRGDR